MKFYTASLKAATLMIVLGLLLSAIPVSFVQAQTTTYTFTTTADSYVNAPYPSRNFGTNTALRVDKSPTTRSYLRFNIKGLNGATITSVKLRVYANFASTSKSGYEVHSLSNNTWTETGITYANAPTPGSLIKATGTFAAKTWTEVDITSAVKGEGSLNLVLTLPDSSDAVSLAARESGGNAPKLIVTASSPQPTATPTSTSKPTIAPTIPPTATPTTIKPTTAPTIPPTAAPTGQPTIAPTSTPSAPTAAPTSQTNTLIFTPSADSYTNAPYPDRNFGTNVALRVDNSPVTYSYLRFNVQGLNGGTITSAQLWIYANSASTSKTGYEVHTLSNNTWTETGITYANQPAPGSLINAAGTFASNAWIQVDITSAVKGEGSLNLALTLPDTSNAVSLAARESGANSPKLSITVSATKPTTAPTILPTTLPTIAPTIAPTAVPSPTPTKSVPIPQGGTAWFVAPSGQSSGDGSQSNPWDLQTALNQPASVKPGDTIWLRGGRYNAPFKSRLKGASGMPIIVRAYPGERVTLDGSGPVLTINDSSWTYYWGFEITNSNATRPYSTNPNPEHGILTNSSYASSNLKFINLVIHDVSGIGMAWWRNNTDSEVYGSLIYNNGTNQLDHGIYTQNETGTKRITNNIIFDNASHGIQVYTSGGSAIDNYIIAGNTIFDNGAVGINTTNGTKGVYVRNLLVGGTLVTHNNTIANNYTYFTSTSTSFNLGYSSGSSNSKVTNNYFMQGKVTIGGSVSGLSFTGNSVFGSPDGFSASSYSGNTFSSSKPAGLKYFVQPNIYEPGRANLTIYNWDQASTISLPASALSGVQIRAGDHYELHNALNFYGDVVTGTYNGSSLALPMTGRSVAKAVGSSNTIPNTFPEFGAFVLINLGQ